MAAKKSTKVKEEVLPVESVTKTECKCNCKCKKSKSIIDKIKEFFIKK